jgi:hypothetical protein
MGSISRELSQQDLLLCTVLQEIKGYMACMAVNVQEPPGSLSLSFGLSIKHLNQPLQANIVVHPS